MTSFESIGGIVDIHVVRGAHAGVGVDLVIEIPHGATETVAFTSLAATLTSPLPDALVDFFHVNTDGSTRCGRSSRTSRSATADRDQGGDLA